MKSFIRTQAENIINSETRVWACYIDKRKNGYRMKLCVDESISPKAIELLTTITTHITRIENRGVNQHPKSFYKGIVIHFNCKPSSITDWYKHIQNLEK